jgi:hypothetical protein
MRANTTYVFIFLGEFGYELLNWQGVIRKFAQQLPESSDIVIAGRKDLDPFYEFASEYIDISDFPMFRESIARAYFALPPDQPTRGTPFTAYELEFDSKLRKALRANLVDKINRPGRRFEFVFSSCLTVYPGCVFGVDRKYYGTQGVPGKIYATLDLGNNIYRRIEPDLRTMSEIEEKLGFDLKRSYVLVQMRRRQIGPQAGERIPEQLLIAELARHMPVVVLSFNTGRRLDSGSSVEQTGPYLVYQARSFRDQGCLIAYAKKCVFFSEGDLGSHTYLPPLMGRDVVVVASQEIFDMPSAPIAFWNKHVFRFGGQMIPWKAEHVFESTKNLREAVDSLFTSGFNNNLRSIL